MRRCTDLPHWPLSQFFHQSEGILYIWIVLYIWFVQTGLTYFLLILLQQLKIPTKYKQPKKSLIDSKPLSYLNHLFELVYLSWWEIKYFQNIIQTGKNNQIEAKPAYGSIIISYKQKSNQKNFSFIIFSTTKQ